MSPYAVWLFSSDFRQASHGIWLGARLGYRMRAGVKGTSKCPVVSDRQRGNRPQWGHFWHVILSVTLDHHQVNRKKKSEFSESVLLCVVPTKGTKLVPKDCKSTLTVQAEGFMLSKKKW